MNIRKWTKDHTLGLILGIITPLIVIPLLVIALSWIQDYPIEQLKYKFQYNSTYRVRILTMSLIGNLLGFYTFLNKERYNFAMGMILGTLAFAPYIIYVKFF